MPRRRSERRLSNSTVVSMLTDNRISTDSGNDGRTPGGRRNMISGKVRCSALMTKRELPPHKELPNARA